MGLEMSLGRLNGIKQEENVALWRHGTQFMGGSYCLGAMALCLGTMLPGTRSSF